MRSRIPLIALVLLALPGARPGWGQENSAGRQAWETAPVLLRISDGICPGESFTVHGGGLETATEALLAPITQPEIPAEPPEKCLPLKPVVTDPEGHFLTCLLPETAEPGAYAVWVRNARGCSAPIALNGSRPQWAADNETSPGLSLLITGRNLDGRDFGAALQSGVRFVNDDRSNEIPITDANPYALTVTIPDSVPTGEYRIEVSNDGMLWRPMEDGRVIRVVERGPDPLGLGVSWANRFRWDSRIDVKDKAYGARGDGKTDDTAAIQKALDELGEKGGGVLFFPQGDYCFTGLVLHAGVVLLGDGRDKTSLVFANREPEAARTVAIDTQGGLGEGEGRCGIARLTIRTAKDAPFPDHFVWLGNRWGDSVVDRRQRTAEHFFVCDAGLTCRDVRTEKDGRGFGIRFHAHGHVLVKNCVMSGYQATCLGYTSEYIQYLDNTFDTTIGNLSAVGTHVVMTGNRMTRHHEKDPAKNSQGIFTRGPSYIAGNTIEHCGTEGQNDGEAICTENHRGGTKMFGAVVKAEKASVTLDPRQADGYLWGREGINTWSLDERTWGDWHILITDGRGMGQCRRLASYDGDATYTLVRPWDIVPDPTSRFVIMLPTFNVTYYQNAAKDCAKGFWFYNDVIDGVIDGNAGVNMEGAFVNSYHIEAHSKKDYRFAVGYFIRIENNRWSGVSTKSHVCGFGTRIGLNAPEAWAYLVYGLEFRNNVLAGTPGAPPMEPFTEAPDVNGIYVVNKNNIAPSIRPAMKSFIIEGNTLTDLDRGISLGGNGYPAYNRRVNEASQKPASWGILIRGNRFENVKDKILDTGTEGTFVIE